MTDDSRTAAHERAWQPGIASVAVVMISLNEAHNMRGVLENLRGWAQEVFLVDSCSRDETVDIALEYGVRVVQRPFRAFGDQWNFALQRLPIRAPWTLKIDPDERLSDQLKEEISQVVSRPDVDGYYANIRLYFMTRPLPVRLRLLRLWRTGKAYMSDVAVNEHLHVLGRVSSLTGDVEHFDSPDLEHWLDKQNKYSTAEALAFHQDQPLSEVPRLFGTRFQRRMWLKKNFYRMPFRYSAVFLYYFFIQGAWRAGWVGYAWSRLRSDVMRLIEYKHREMQITGKVPGKRFLGPGRPDPRVPQFD
jgi:glycosyltransferase involved in cell wall biosynthesis